MTEEDPLRTAGPRRAGRFVALAVVPMLACGGEPGALPGLEPGDLLFQVERSADAVHMQLRDASTYTSVAVVLTVGETPEQTDVFATNDSVRIVDLATWRAEGMGGHVAVRRLAQELDPAGVQAIADVARTAVRDGAPYTGSSGIAALFREALHVDLRSHPDRGVTADDLHGSPLLETPG